MTPHYDLKQQEKQQWYLGGWAGGGGHKHFCHISGGIEYVLQTGLGGSTKFLPTTWKCYQPLHLVINDSSLRKIIIRYKRTGYNMNVMRQNACLAVNPISVDNFAALFNCGSGDLINDGSGLKTFSLKVDWTFELLWDPLLTISPNLFFWKQLTVRSLQSK